MLRLSCSVDEEDALVVTYERDFDEDLGVWRDEASWMFEIVGSKDPVFLTDTQFDAIQRWRTQAILSTTVPDKSRGNRPGG
jgi:hypothetical protein